MKIAHVTPLLLQKRFRGTRQGPGSCLLRSGVIFRNRTHFNRSKKESKSFLSEVFESAPEGNFFSPGSFCLFF
ncbi:hypothetical protein BOX24_07000 [Leptospirillum ferriphilum]|uniref:Uncharacterized protein n=1 Tax=Leptospirillum ferriphilum TaxID=178606 RepID=A0A1V3SUP2_9BACT|nr:hypothetical protein BOX24_07000 [Leptospirillum ferriphilum]